MKVGSFQLIETGVVFYVSGANGALPEVRSNNLHLMDQIHSKYYVYNWRKSVLLSYIIKAPVISCLMEVDNSQVDSIYDWKLV